MFDHLDFQNVIKASSLTRQLKNFSGESRMLCFQHAYRCTIFPRPTLARFYRKYFDAASYRSRRFAAAGLDPLGIATRPQFDRVYEIMRAKRGPLPGPLGEYRSRLREQAAARAAKAIGEN